MYKFLIQMKKIYIIKLIIVSLGLILFSCDRQDVESPEFTVWTDSTTFKVGDEITFRLSGNPQNIVFWSGEFGHIFENRNRVREKGILQTFQFTSQVGAGSQNNNLSVLISKDFNGKHDSLNVSKANWIDVTSRCLLSSSSTTSAGLSALSGQINITDIDSTFKPLYFAFHYISEQNSLIPRSWTISNFTVTNKLADGTTTTVVPSFGLAGFTLLNLKDTTYRWDFRPDNINPSSMKISASTISQALQNEDWAISAPIDINEVIKTDFGIPVSSLLTLNPPTTFIYTFTKSGTYKVTFEAFNQNVYDKKSITKEITLTIVP